VFPQPQPTMTLYLVYVLVPATSLTFLVFTFRTARPQTEAESLCRFRLGVSIGREKNELQDKWFLVLLNPYHNGHGREDLTSLRKPKRLRSDMEVQLAKDVMDSYGGSGVASSLYYHRTGEVLDRRILHQLTSIGRQDVALRTGSPAQSLIEDLRCVQTSKFLFLSYYITTFLYLILPCRSDQTIDFLAVYSDNTTPAGSVSLLEKVRLSYLRNVSVHITFLLSQINGAQRDQTPVSINIDAAADIASTRSAMQINGKMLLGSQFL
jgi:hypothetical protein